jgi:hypothetical protein
MPKKKLEIDGPAGRQEVCKNYRDNYDLTFRNKTELYHNGRKVCETMPSGGVRQFLYDKDGNPTTWVEHHKNSKEPKPRNYHGCKNLESFDIHHSKKFPKKSQKGGGKDDRKKTTV